MKKKLMSMAILGSIAFLQGCASTIEAFHSRPVVKDSLQDVVSTVSLSADRRTVIVVTNGKNKSKFCAEAPPDTAKEISAQLKAISEAEAKSQKTQIEGKGKASLEDNIDTKVVVIGARTEAVEVFRTGVYALCQYHLNGGMDSKQLQASFDNLVKTLFAPKQN